MPFERYIPVRQGDGILVREVFRPNMSFREAPGKELYAIWNDRSYGLLTVEDIARWNHKMDDAQNILRSRIGERMLAVILDSLVHEMVEQEGHGVTGEVLRESPKYRGRELIAGWSREYALKHKGESGFVVLRKFVERPASFYRQEKYGLHASELDGLAYLDLTDRKFIIVGEAKTSERWAALESTAPDGDGEYKRKPLDDRVAEPLRKIFPDHDLLYLFLGREDRLFDGESLMEGPSNLCRSLKRSGIESIFVPFPEMPRTLDEYAADMVDALKVAQAAKKHWLAALMEGV